MATPTPAQLAIATLYTAAFDRAPDASGFDFWMQAYQQGASLNVLAGTFLGTPEGQAEYPSAMSSQDFVSAFYTSVFGRAADAGGLEFWSAALDALGGAGNADAKAALMVSIIGVASTPLDGQPAGLSDEAYAQTVADRAQFINKAEVGVYFAVELRSNDVSLAKQVLALVTADPASVNTATAFADQASNPGPVTPPVIGPALTSADDATTIASKLAAYSGTSASADTTNMEADQLKALAAGAGKLKGDGLIGTPIFSSDLLATEVLVLMGKYSGSTATVDASGFTSTQLASLSGSLDKLTLIQQPSLALADAWLTPRLMYLFLLKSTEAQLDTTGFSTDHLPPLFSVLEHLADNGLTGDLFVPSVVNVEMLDVLFQKATTATTISVSASSMTVDRLVSLFKNADKIDSVSNLSVLTGVWAELSSDIGTLLSKGTDIQANLTGASVDQLKGVTAYTTHYAVNGLTGSYTLDGELSSSQLSALLSDRVADAATVTVQTADMTSAQLLAVAQGIGKADTIVDLSLNASNTADLSEIQIASLLSKTTDASADASNLSASVLAVLAANARLSLASDALTGALSLDATLGADAIGTLLDHYAASAASADATDMNAAQLKAIVAGADKFKADGLTGSYTLDVELNSSQLSVLLNDRVADAATVTVQAADMVSVQLLAVAQGIGKADTIVDLSLNADNIALLSNSQIADLLSKATDASVDISNLSYSVLVVLAAHGGSLASDGLTGALSLDATFNADAIGVLLDHYATSAVIADVTDMDAAQLKAIAGGASKFVANGLSGALALSNAVTASEAEALLAAYGGSMATANAVDMDADYLAVLADATSKFAVGSIATPTLLVGNASLDDTATETLLAKSIGVQIVATDATAAELLSILDHIDNVASGGIQGTFALKGDLDAAQLTSLLGKLDEDARVTADVSGMQASQLAVLAANPLALNAGALTGTLDLNKQLTATAVTVLLNRYAGTDASLLATDVGSDALNATAATLGKVASISGELEILSDVIPSYGLLLLSKYVGSTTTVDASSFNSSQLQSLYGSLDKLTTITQPKLVLADAWLTPDVMANLLAKSVDAQIADADSADLANLLTNLPNIAADGIVGSLEISASTADATSLDTLLQKTAVAATVNVDASAMNLDQLVALFKQASKVDSVSNLYVPSSIWAQLPADFGGLLGKGSDIQVELSGASAAQLQLVADSSTQYSAGGLTGTFKLDDSFTATQLGALLGDRVDGAADVSVDAASMDVDQVVALFANAANVDHLTNLSAPSGTMARLGWDFGVLFTKGFGGTMAVDLTGATNSQLEVIDQYSNSYKEDGLTGSYTIDKDLDWHRYGSLLGDGVADAANVTIQAAGMDGDQLAAVLDGIDKVDTILGLSLTTANTASLSDSQVASLLSKATGADVTGITDLQFTGMLGLVADGTLKGALSLGLSELQAATVSTLNTKLSTEATLKITGTGGADIIDLTGLSKMADVNGGAGADSITLGSGGGTVFIGGQAESRSADFSLSQATSDKLDRITMNGGDVIVKLSQAPGAFGGSGMTFSSQSVTPLKQWAAPMPVGAFSDLSLVLGGDFGSPSTSAAVSWGVLTLISYPFNNTLEGKYLIIFDDTPGFDINDTIIELLGTSSTFTVTI